MARDDRAGMGLTARRAVLVSVAGAVCLATLGTILVDVEYVLALFLMPGLPNTPSTTGVAAFAARMVVLAAAGVWVARFAIRSSAPGAAVAIAVYLNALGAIGQALLIRRVSLPYPASLWLWALLPGAVLAGLAEYSCRRGRVAATEILACGAAFVPVATFVLDYFASGLTYQPVEQLVPFVMPTIVVAVAAIAAGFLRRSVGYTLAGEAGVLVFLILVEVHRRYLLNTQVGHQAHPDLPYLIFVQTHLGRQANVTVLLALPLVTAILLLGVLSWKRDAC